MRNGFDQETLRRKSLRIAENLFKFREYEKYGNVLFFLSKAGEVCTDEMIRQSLRMGKKVYVPLVDKEGLQLKITELPSMEIDFDLNEYGIREPGKKFLHLVSPRVIDFVAVPGLAFDRKGGRLGHGVGYYDRFLKQISPTARRVALAFDFQVLDAVPREDFDVPVQNIITETRTINC